MPDLTYKRKLTIKVIGNNLKMIFMGGFNQMYKYQCSKDDCGAVWTLREGKLNGFVLTCPVCGKGRGLYIAQAKNEYERSVNDRAEEITITIGANSAGSVDGLDLKINEFIKKHSLQVVTKSIEASGKNIVCSVQYKLKE